MLTNKSNYMCCRCNNLIFRIMFFSEKDEGVSRGGCMCKIICLSKESLICKKILEIFAKENPP